MSPSRRSTHQHYGYAVLAIALALGMGLLIPGSGLLFLLAAVTLATLYGGLRLGLEVVVLFVGLGIVGARNQPPGVSVPMHVVSFAILALFIAGLTQAMLVARRRAEADAAARRTSEERYQLAMRASREGIWDWDLLSGQIYRSPRLEEMLGAASADPADASPDFAERVHPEDRDRVFIALRRHLERRVPFNVECRMQCASGDYRWFRVSGQATWNNEGRPIRMAGSVGDITLRKRAERQLLEAKETAESAGRSKDLFFAMLSHELRAPLTPALLGISAALDDPQIPTNLRDVLEAAKRGIALEARLVDDLLDVTRIAAGKLRLNKEPVDIHALAQQAVDSCRDDLRISSLRVELDLHATETYVEADSARLQQVLWNLIKNATKFTPAGGCVTIRTRNERNGRFPANKMSVVLEVVDTGVGIDPELLPRVFEAFRQGEPGRVPAAHGLGLGLAISRSIAEAHGGILSARSDGKDQGATFSLELVALPVMPHTKLAPKPFRTIGLPRALRVLLVEDDPDTYRILTRLLMKRGLEVTVADSLDAARKELQADQFDLVISDLGLPDGSGLDLIRWIREGSQIPAIALTGYGMEDDVQRCRAAGFSAHLTKPVEFQRLEEAIRGLTAPAHSSGAPFPNPLSN